MKKFFKKENRNFIIFLLIILLVFISKNIYFSQKNRDSLQIHFIDVGQGDSILIKTPNNKTCLIDSGGNKAENKVTGYLYLHGIKKIDYLIATHPDEDHIGAMDKVVYDFDIGHFSMPIVENVETKNFKNLSDALSSKNITNIPLYRGDKIKLSDDIIMEVLSPIKDKYYSSSNLYSIVVKLTYKNYSFLFTGDSERENEEDMLDKNLNLKSNVIKLGHHGSKSSSSMEFLAEVDPDIAIISAGKDNKYGHPHEETLYNLNALEIPYLTTQKESDIVIISDGEKMWREKNDDIIKTIDDTITGIFKKSR